MNRPEHSKSNSPAEEPHVQNPQLEVLEDDPHIKLSQQSHEVHIYTIPNRAGEYYSNSDVVRHILENPALYMGSADF